jgi:hypothetical protein
VVSLARARFSGSQLCDLSAEQPLGEGAFSTAFPLTLGDEKDLVVKTYRKYIPFVNDDQFGRVRNFEGDTALSPTTCFIGQGRAKFPNPNMNGKYGTFIVRSMIRRPLPFLSRSLEVRGS